MSKVCELPSLSDIAMSGQMPCHATSPTQLPRDITHPTRSLGSYLAHAAGMLRRNLSTLWLYQCRWGTTLDRQGPEGREKHKGADRCGCKRAEGRQTDASQQPAVSLSNEGQGKSRKLPWPPRAAPCATVPRLQRLQRLQHPPPPPPGPHRGGAVGGGKWQEAAGGGPRAEMVAVVRGASAAAVPTLRAYST